MPNTHALVYFGTKRKNWENRSSLTNVFIDAHDKPAQVLEPNAYGICFGVKGLERRGDGVVFRVGDVTLHDACLLDLGGKEMMPQGKPIGDDIASTILDDAIRINPEQADELSAYRATITL